MTLASALAARVTSLTANDLTPDAERRLKDLVFDYLGVALRGSQAESGRIVREYVAAQGGADDSTVIGQPGRVPASQAAFANAISEHSIELDDVDELALFHFGPPIVSTALAVAERQRSSGLEFLIAVLAGCDIMERLSRATNNELRNRGFHTTPTCGVFASTATAGRLLGLTPQQLTNAFGIAGAQASGLMEMYGPSMQKRFNPGPAARNGIVAAELAQRGFTGADTIFEGERGFGQAFAGKLDERAARDRLDSGFPIIVEHKPHSAARPIHNAIDCALDIRARAGAPVDAIETIVVKRHPDWAHYHLNAHPQTFHEAQVSLPYAVAATFVFGAAMPDQFADQNLERTDIRRLVATTTVEPDASLQRGVSCDMTVTFADGSSLRSVVDHPKGSKENPLSRDELSAKFRGLTDGLLPDGAAERIRRTVDDLETLDDMTNLLSLFTETQ
ncbi:MmgE/PrpD family protein [Paramicrobacterium chengjingii]|uniref:MmgE/PrpD family protein n=1 Tax=Paramicrobacterium chengjingii TaxID=2769067 RepID=UPI001422AA85|nr:MmgE/PrpD family protein [Microbacterium chengjingii]